MAEHWRVATYRITSNRIKRLRRWVRRWRSLQWQERLIVIEAFWLLGIARATVLFVPFKRVAPHLGQAQGESESGEPSSAVHQVAQAITLASRHTPWQSNCFAQALAGHLMLRRRHASNTLYLGVYKKEDKFLAHAWLRSGDLVVTGRSGHESYTILARYAWQPQKGQRAKGF